MARILITPRSLTSDPPAALDQLRKAGHELVFCSAGQTPDEAELIALLPGVEGWLAGVEPVSPAVIAAADSLRVIARNGSGADNLPMAMLNARGIAVTRAMAANATGVAELALGLILAACRHLPVVAAGVRAGAWPRPKGREIEGTTVAIIGAGAIGRKVAAVMQQMGASVLAVDPASPDLGPDIRLVSLPEALAEAEIITLHCPLPADGKPLIDAGRMRHGAILVNTARAGLVDESAILAALNGGTLSCYATDVFAQEPPRPGGIAEHPAVIATSHIGGLTEASVNRATVAAVQSLLAVLGETADAT